MNKETNADGSIRAANPTAGSDQNQPARMMSPQERARAIFEQRGLNDRQIEAVTAIKSQAEALHMAIDGVNPVSGEAARLISLARTSLEECVMWATKAVSRENPPVLK